jgi:hypothetical protein
MHKPSPSRMNILASMAAQSGIAMSISDSTARLYNKLRGAAPAGFKYITGVYRPGGSNPNVLPSICRNPKIIANVQMMHEKWLSAKNARIVAKQNIQASKAIEP